MPATIALGNGNNWCILCLQKYLRLVARDGNCGRRGSNKTVFIKIFLVCGVKCLCMGTYTPTHCHLSGL